MTTLVIDASIAVKWVVEEDGTSEALTLRRRAKVIAPELLVAECANILWKKVQRDELSNDEALLAARLAAERDCRFVTADESFVRKLSEGHRRRFRGRVIGLAQAAREVGRPRSLEP